MPSVGRLGLVDDRAARNLAQLGWNTEERIDLLWSLSRAPDADAALCAMVRLAEALGDDWDELNAALATDRGLRGRLFGVLGSSLALGDHLVANPQSWQSVAGQRAAAVAPSSCAPRSPSASLTPPSAAGSVVWRLRTLYRDRLLVLAALDLAPTVENEPVLPFTAVGAHLSDIADAALAAALSVAEVTVCGDSHTAAAGGHRDGQMRCARTELRQRRRRDLRRRVAPIRYPPGWPAR